MPAAVALAAEHIDRVAAYQAAMTAAGRKTGRSTMQAARTFCAKLERAGGWEQLSRARQLDAIAKARSFASWLMVTGQLTIDADVLGRVYLRLGTSARVFCPDAHAWFVDACGHIDIRPADIALQWNTLAMITAVTGTAPEQVGDHDFNLGSAAVIDAYVARGKPESGRNMASIFHRLRLTLFHAGRLDSHGRPPRRPPVSVTGWAAVAPGFAENARRYVAQVQLSLRPSTVKHIETTLREFGTWLGTAHPEVASCAELERPHIEDYKAWVSAKHGRYTGKPLSRISIKNRLINLHCFFDRTTEWGYPNPPHRPLIFAGDLPIVDKPLHGPSTTRRPPSS
jgi:integrase/recombinase XerD